MDAHPLFQENGRPWPQVQAATTLDETHYPVLGKVTLPAPSQVSDEDAHLVARHINILTDKFCQLMPDNYYSHTEHGDDVLKAWFKCVDGIKSDMSLPDAERKVKGVYAFPTHHAMQATAYKGMYKDFAMMNGILNKFGAMTDEVVPDLVHFFMMRRFADESVQLL